MVSAGNPRRGYPHVMSGVRRVPPLRPSFGVLAWPEVAALMHHMANANPAFRAMADIVESVIASRSTDLLAASTSMHDLIVVPVPVTEPVYESVIVRAPSSLDPPREGHVLIEHLASNGRNDRIERPFEEAVPLFWRFMAEKYGVRPVDPPTATA